MAEQQNKGIALVILGIVAIIAIVGLVLLFTGAKKAATGEFAVPTAKEYGGAIRGLTDPYSRAFVGRTYEGVGPGAFGAGATTDIADPYSGLGANQQKVAQVVTGETGTTKTVSSAISYNRNREQTPSLQTSCNGLMKDLMQLGYSSIGGVSLAGEWVDLTAQQAVGWQGDVLPVDQIWQITYETPYYGLDGVYSQYKGMGHLACGTFDGGNNPGQYSSNPRY